MAGRGSNTAPTGGAARPQAADGDRPPLGRARTPRADRRHRAPLAARGRLSACGAAPRRRSRRCRGGAGRRRRRSPSPIAQRALAAEDLLGRHRLELGVGREEAVDDGVVLRAQDGAGGVDEPAARRAPAARSASRIARCVRGSSTKSAGCSRQRASGLRRSTPTPSRARRTSTRSARAQRPRPRSRAALERRHVERACDVGQAGAARALAQLLELALARRRARPGARGCRAARRERERLAAGAGAGVDHQAARRRRGSSAISWLAASCSSKRPRGTRRGRRR